MGLGICNLSIVPVRISDSDKSEMITQLVYGDLFTIVEEKDKWTKIKCEFDNYEGWIDSKQYKRLDKSDNIIICLLYTSPSPRDYAASRMPSSA